MQAEKSYRAEKDDYISHHPGDIEEEVSHASKADAKTLKKEVHTLADHVASKYKKLQKAFLEMDTDGSGRLSPLELEQAIKHMNLNIPHEHILQITVEMADQDGDGQLDYAEFCKLVKEKDTSDPEWILGGRTKGVVGEFQY